MEQTLQIGIFGDSISKGIVLDAETHRYSSLKKEITEWISPSTALHNFSVMGSTIQKGLSIITRHTDQLASYQNVFLEFGGNDCDFDWSAVSERPQAHHEPHTPLKQFEALYTKAIQLIQEKKGNPILYNRFSAAMGCRKGCSMKKRTLRRTSAIGVTEPISRVLSSMVIYLDCTSPHSSSRHYAIPTGSVLECRTNRRCIG